MMDRELTREKKDQLLRRVTELLDEDVLKIQDWMAIYEILVKACERQQAEIMEAYLIDSLSGD